jgi:hypothetical protein
LKSLADAGSAMNDDMKRIEFISAYLAWHEAWAEYADKVDRAARFGEPIGMNWLLQQCEELARLQQEWIAQSRPFVDWR